MPISLSERVRTVSSAFYRLYDDYEAGTYYFIRDVFDDHIIATAGHEEKSYRIAYQWNDGEVSFGPSAEWEEVKQEWVPARSLEEDERIKHALLGIERRTPTLGFGRGEAPADPVQHDFKPQVRFSSDENRSTFLITTGALARDGMILDPDGIDVSAYLQNPVVLWNHGRDIVRGGLPVARALSLERKRSEDPNQNGWLATLEWYDDEFSQNLKRAVKGGFVSMTSIKWQPLKRSTRQVDGRSVPVDEKSEMLEFSIVDVGADRNALPVERSADIRTAIKEEISAALAAIHTERATPAAAPEGTAESAKGEPAAPEVPAVPVKRKATTADYERMISVMAERAVAEALTQLKRKTGRA